MSTKTEQIRTLNDELRQNLSEGTAVMTCGVAAFGAESVARIVKTIAVFDDFCNANDPHHEHDFGAFKSEGHVIFFKIDYYDKTLACHSPDATDRFVTERVIHHHVGRRVLTTADDDTPSLRLPCVILTIGLLAAAPAPLQADDLFQTSL